MDSPIIVIAGTRYKAPPPSMRLWRLLNKFYSERKQRQRALQELWQQITAARDVGDAEKLDAFIADATERADELRRYIIDEKIRLICFAFDDDAVTPDSIDDNLTVADVVTLFDTIEAWVNAIASGRLASLPNAGPAE